jgi:multidrug efflux pump
MSTLPWRALGGIIVGTMLTLLFLPALYVAWFRIKEPEPATDNNHENPIALRLQTDLSAVDAPRRCELENESEPV